MFALYSSRKIRQSDGFTPAQQLVRGAMVPLGVKFESEITSVGWRRVVILLLVRSPCCSKKTKAWYFSFLFFLFCLHLFPPPLISYRQLNCIAEAIDSYAMLLAVFSPFY